MNMATPEEASKQDIATLQEEEENHIKAVNTGMDQISIGMLATAKAVANAIEWIRKNNNSDEEFKKAKDKFFEKTQLAMDPSTQSKFEKIAKNMPLIEKYNDNIPQNFTSYYIIASSELAANTLPKYCNSEAKDDQSLTQDCTVKQVQMLMKHGNKNYQNDKLPFKAPLFTITYGDKDLKKQIKKKAEAIEQGIDKVLTEELGSDHGVKISLSKAMEMTEIELEKSE
jgi:hypothetical protein